MILMELLLNFFWGQLKEVTATLLSKVPPEGAARQRHYAYFTLVTV